MKYFPFTVILAIWLLCCLGACQPDPAERQVLFSTFLEQEKLWNEGKQAFSDQQWEKSRLLFSRVFIIDRIKESWIQQAACLLYLKKRPEAREAMMQAFQYGAHPSEFQDMLFENKSLLLDSLYRNIHPDYIDSQDTTLAHELRQLLLTGATSIRTGPTLRALRAWVDKYGWPSHPTFGASSDLPFRMTQFIVKGSEEDLQFFLPHMIASASENRTSWTYVQEVMVQSMLAFVSKENPRVKLRQVYLDPQGKLDWERSLAQLHALAKAYSGKHIYLEIYPVDYPGKGTLTNPQTALQAIIPYLIQQGLDPVLLGSDKQPKKVEEDDLGPYVFELSVAL